MGERRQALITEPFMAFGGGTVPPRTVVKAPTPANPQQGIIAGGGTVYSFDPNAANPASTMRLEAWGFRNPYGIGFDPFNKNQLFVSNNGADVRQTTINGGLRFAGPGRSTTIMTTCSWSRSANGSPVLWPSRFLS